MKPKVFEQIELKAPIDSPTFTGLPNSTTPGTTSNDTRIATTEFVNSLGLVPNVTTISTVQDLNTITTGGFYYMSSGVSNGPQITPYMVGSSMLVMGNLSNVCQIISNRYGFFVRARRFNTWSAWEEITTSISTKFVKTAGDTMTGILTAKNNDSYTTAQVRNITISQDEPSGGGNGDIWLRYE